VASYPIMFRQDIPAGLGASRNRPRRFLYCQRRSIHQIDEISKVSRACSPTCLN
jgi:hypothetical protein